MIIDPHQCDFTSHSQRSKPVANPAATVASVDKLALHGRGYIAKSGLKYDAYFLEGKRARFFTLAFLDLETEQLPPRDRPGVHEENIFIQVTVVASVTKVIVMRKSWVIGWHQCRCSLPFDGLTCR